MTRADSDRLHARVAGRMHLARLHHHRRDDRGVEYQSETWVWPLWSARLWLVCRSLAAFIIFRIATPFAGLSAK
jgi:hypothetical protein